jgi:gamma-glutamylcysteine synthetase
MYSAFMILIIVIDECRYDADLVSSREKWKQKAETYVPTEKMIIEFSISQMSLKDVKQAMISSLNSLVFTLKNPSNIPAQRAALKVEKKIMMPVL